MKSLNFSDKRVVLGTLAAAVVVILFCTFALLAVFGGGGATAHHNRSLAAATATDSVSTPTSPPTATTIPSSPTPTPVPHPLPVPSNAPPPAHNSSPVQIKPTPITATPTPCVDATTCVHPTPGPCQPGGAPYYITPTATPSTSTIAQTITNAANRNGISVPLQEAIAWQESGWQENVIACDGGIGLMQLMPATVTWLNGYYGVNDNPYDLNGNAGLGAGYISYYYNYYTGYIQTHYPATCGSSGCNWDTVWPGDKNGVTVRDIVISVYNEGAGTMATKGIINWTNYVQPVLAFYHSRYGGVGK
jgi:hypothetical protein